MRLEGGIKTQPQNQASGRDAQQAMLQVVNGPSALPLGPFSLTGSQTRVLCLAIGRCLYSSW